MNAAASSTGGIAGIASPFNGREVDGPVSVDQGHGVGTLGRALLQS